MRLFHFYQANDRLKFDRHAGQRRPDSKGKTGVPPLLTEELDERIVYPEVFPQVVFEMPLSG
jgi:hypothetical protein